MKRMLIPFILLGLAACVVSQPNLPPPETAAALTLDAMPSRNDTPIPPQSAESTPETPNYTPTSNTEFDPNAPGVYCIPTQTERIRALVSRVIDGETIEVSIDNTPYNVRYIGLQAPGIALDQIVDIRLGFMGQVGNLQQVREHVVGIEAQQGVSVKYEGGHAGHKDDIVCNNVHGTGGRIGPHNSG